MPRRVDRPTLSGVKHGRSGYRRGCGCDVCREANNEYLRQRRQFKGREETGRNVVSITGRRGKTESSDSESKPREIGAMEQAIIDECKDVERAKQRPTLYQSAINLAKVIDNPEFSGAAVQTTKQLMAIMKELHNDDENRRATGKRKSGGRLATVAGLTKVKRQGA